MFLLKTGWICLVLGATIAVPVLAEPTFVRGETQYIAALGDFTATSGTNAET